MSFFDSAKDFFGLGPVDNGEDDAYYDDPQYSSSSSGSTAYNRDRGDLRDRAEPLLKSGYGRYLLDLLAR